ncbi:hypothetical protein MBLNU230_g1332t1 [Neophaeotheca triangularis]
MAEEYDPLASPKYSVASSDDGDVEMGIDTGDNSNLGTTWAQNVANDDDDEDYDPSTFNFGDTADQSTPAQADAPQAQENAASAAASANPSQVPSRTASAAPSASAACAPPKTIAGFVQDDSDEEEDDDTHTPQPSQQANGTETTQSGLGAVAVAESQEQIQGDVPIHSEAQDTAAVPSTSSTSLNGSTATNNIPAAASMSEVASAIPVTTPAQASPPATNGESANGEGKNVSTQQAPISAAATPQPSTQAPSVLPNQTNDAEAPAASTARLPHDKIGQLEDRIKDGPKVDIEAWFGLINHYKEKSKLDEARGVYQRMLKVFPSSPALWLQYGNLELAEDDLSRFEKILNDSLFSVPDIDLWFLYLDYLRRRHPLTTDTTGQNRGILQQAFEIAVQQVGGDPDAGKLWRDYVEFVKSGPGNVGDSGWQDQQKKDLLRKVYQEGVTLPHGELTKLWKEYDNFELSLNKASGRKYLQERSPAYMTARTARTQIEGIISGLDRRAYPKLPPIYGFEGEDEFADQVEGWKKWIQWEKEDPLVLKDEDVNQYRARILFVYKQSLASLRFYPEIWFEASEWCFEQGTDELTGKGEEILNGGIEANPESVLLALSKADRIENSLPSGGEIEVVVRNGQKLEVPYENVLKALYDLRARTVERESKSIQEVQERYAAMPPDSREPTPAPKNDDDEDDPNPTASKPTTRAEKETFEINTIKAATTRLTENLKNTISYVWIAYMRAFRRIQGQGGPKTQKKGLRGVFGDARPRGQLTSEVYVENALLEHHCYKDPSASRIFEKGMKLFPTDELFALEYIKYLIGLNDHTNARAVFETTITKIMALGNSTTNAATGEKSVDRSLQREKCRPLITYMHAFESQFGDLPMMKRLETRMADLYPEEPSLNRFAHRFLSLGGSGFDAMATQLQLHPSQARPRGSFPQEDFPTIPQGGNQTEAPGGGQLMLGPNGPYLASPKRTLDDVSDVETPQRKFARGDSPAPLKGAAGRRIVSNSISSLSPSVANMNAIKPANADNAAPGGGGGFMTRNYQPGQPPTSAAGPPPGGPVGPPKLPPQVNFLLSIIPPAQHYRATVFNPQAMVDLLRGVDLTRARGV